MYILTSSTSGSRVKSAFQAPNIDELLGDISNSSRKVKICAECLTDNLLVDDHKTLIDSYVKVTEIHEVGQDTNQDVKELHKKMDEMMGAQKSLQGLLDEMSGKNSLFQLLLEQSSRPRSRFPSRPSATERS